jgi:hypothetical protein
MVASTAVTGDVGRRRGLVASATIVWDISWTPAAPIP